jgi:Ribosome inactivating protein
MAKQDSVSSSDNNKDCRVRKEINLRDPARYAASIEWVRKNVVVRNTTGTKVLQLDVLVSDGEVTLYMNTENQYVMGFRGADKVYLLNDDDTEKFKAWLAEELQGAAIEVLNNLHTRHGGGAGGLETFVDNLRGRVFRRKELNCAQKLSGFVHKGDLYEELRKPLSLLVCMICESARFMILEKDFTNQLYYDYNVWADESIQAYAKAKLLLRLAERAFPAYSLQFAVDKLQKRATEMDENLQRLKRILDRKDTRSLIGDILKGSASATPSTSDEIKRFKELCDQAKVSDPDEINDMINYSKNESAVRAAKDGVAYLRPAPQPV